MSPIAQTRERQREPPHHGGASDTEGSQSEPSARDSLKPRPETPPNTRGPLSRVRGHTPTHCDVCGDIPTAPTRGQDPCMKRQGQGWLACCVVHKVLPTRDQSRRTGLDCTDYIQPHISLWLCIDRCDVITAPAEPKLLYAYPYPYPYPYSYP